MTSIHSRNSLWKFSITKITIKWSLISLISLNPSTGINNALKILSREKLDQYSNLKMELFTTVSGMLRLIREMEEEFRYGQTVLATMDIGRTALLMVMED